MEELSSMGLVKMGRCPHCKETIELVSELDRYIDDHWESIVVVVTHKKCGGEWTEHYELNNVLGMEEE